MIYRGIVEGNNDPKKLGRVQVRVFGKHTDNRNNADSKNYVPTADLPWSDVLYSSAISENSDFSTIQNGTYVVLEYYDQEEQYPLVIGCLPRIENLPDFTKGFSDPNQVYPKSSNVDRTSLSKYAVGDLTPTSITNKISGVKSGGAHGDSISEPATPFGPVYPNNRVIQTAGGHVIELDDTSGKERVHIFHSSGAFVEIHPTGKLVIHSKSDMFLVSDGKQNIYAGGNVNVHAEGDINLEATGTVNIGKASTLSGVVTNLCVCPITGQPHSDYSLDVLATKG